MLAVYGLMVTKVTLTPDLGLSHQLSGKILSFQLALVSSVIPSIIIGILVNNDVVKCGPIFPSKARGEGKNSRNWYYRLLTVLGPAYL